MKNLLLITMLLAMAFSGYAQTDSTWTKSDAEIYGSPREKREQDAMFNQTGYDLYRVIGFKEYYANGISFYLQSHGFNMDDDARYFKGGAEFVFTPRISMSKPVKTSVKYWVNADRRITKMRITGPFSTLAFLFLNYWPTSIEWTSAGQLKRGTVAKKMLINEIITYHNTGVSSFIEISK